jgi:hypothetical protein
VIVADRVTIYSLPGAAQEGWRMKIDAAKRPRAIDLLQDDLTHRGVYEVEGDTLRMRLANPGDPRPSELKPGAKPGEQMIVLRRQPFAPSGTAAVAADVEGAYDENEALADEKYTDRRVIVLGLVDRVRRQGAGYALVMKAAGSTPLLFEFAEGARKELAGLKRDQLVIVEGKCKGRGRAGSGKEVIAFSGAKVVKGGD